MPFTHLHVHSHYSLLDGLPKIPSLVEAAKEAGFNSLALTDHGNMYGAVEFYKTCKLAGIKPIIGIEAYVAPGSLTEKQGSGHSDYFHITLLAKNLAGYKNLMELITVSHLEGFYYKPRIDKKALAQFKEGIVALSGCLRGEVSRAITNSGLEQAKKIALEYQNTMASGMSANFFSISLLPARCKSDLRISRRLGSSTVVPVPIHTNISCAALSSGLR